MIFRPPPGLRSETVDLECGTRIHLVSNPQAHPELITASIVIELGGAHLGGVDSCGTSFFFPPGMAHFMEHLLFWAGFHLIEDLELRCGTSNAVVLHDRTLWYVNDALVENVETACTQVIGHLLTIATAYGCDSAELESRIPKTVADILNEIAYRGGWFTRSHSSSLFSAGVRSLPRVSDAEMRKKLLELLYPESGLRYDPLGNRESLEQIGLGHVETALRLIRSNIRSVVLQGENLPVALASPIADKVEQVTDKRPDRLLVPRDRLPELERTGSGPGIAGIGTEFFGEDALVLLGLKLPPLLSVTPARDELVRRLALHHLLLNAPQAPLGGILTRNARALFSFARIHNEGLFFLDDFKTSQVIASLRRAVLDKLADVRRHHSGLLKKAYLDIADSPRNIVRLCHAFDAGDFTLAEGLDAITSLTPGDLDILITEVEECGDIALVHAGRYSALF